MCLNLLGSLQAGAVHLAPGFITVESGRADRTLLAATAVICTARGLVVLAAQDGPANGAADEAACIFCLPLSAGTCNAPAVASTIAYSTPRIAAALPAEAIGWALPGARHWPARPRAPPRIA